MPIAVQRLEGATPADVSWFCEGLPDAAAVERRLERYLRSGSVRPEWCYLAAANGQVAGRHWWWSAPGDRRPTGVDLVSVENSDSALTLLRRARDELRVEDAICELGIHDEETAVEPPGRALWTQLLRDSGFSLASARVRVRATPAAVPTNREGELAFRTARSLPTESLIELFRAVADGSLDHGMIEDRARYGDTNEAVRRLDRALSFAADPDWFSVMVTQDREPVGYVVPAVVDGIAVIAEVGVARAHRRHGNGLQLVGYGVRLLSATGAKQILADTDQANGAMRAVFARAGFTESEPYEIYRYVRDQA